MVERDDPQLVRSVKPYNGIPRPGSPEELILVSPSLAKARLKRQATLVNENDLVTKRTERLPYLYGDARVRYDPLQGSIHIRSWIRTKPKKQDRQGEFDLQIPTVSKKRWTSFKDVETAIRASTHIIEKNSPGGQNLDGLNAVIDLSQDLFDRFTVGDITPETIPDYLDYAYTVLKDSHLLKAKVPNKQDTVKQIIEALGKDSLKRFNSLISRTKLASSIIKLLEEKLIAGQTQEKYNYILVSLLLAERNTERFYILQMINQIKSFLNLSDENKELKNAGLNLRTVSRKFLSPELILVAPYRQATVFFDALVFGWPKENIKGQKKLFSSMFPEIPLETIDEIHKEPKNGSPESIEKFRRSLASGIEILQDVLDRGARNLESKSV